MKLIILESPFAGSNLNRNLTYARRALRHSLARGEAPIASHLLYPQALNENNQAERIWGIEAGLAWLAVADLQVFYIDYGRSPGMIDAEHAGIYRGIPQQVRKIGPNPEAES
jgi:hypothetical protein